MINAKYLYVLVDGVNKTHFGAFVDEQTARKKARFYEQVNHLRKGQIDIYEIPEWEIHAE